MAPESASAAGRALYVAIPGELDTRTGGYGYDRRIIAGLRDRGWTVNVLRLDASFPAPTPAARGHAAQVLAAIPDGATVLVDGLALGALPEEVEREASRLTIVALVHHPLAAETGLDPALAAAFEVSERRALAAVRSVVVTSRTTSARLRDYGVSADRVAVVEPGTDPAPIATRSRHGERAAVDPEPAEVALLCVATLTPRKGHELLLNALASIPYRDWRLTCAGSLDRDPATVARVRTQIRNAGLDNRVSLVGDLDQAALAIQYDRADVFVLATLYEGYGMAVAEALSRGVPIVSTETGAIDYLVTGGVGVRADVPAGIVVPPGDLAAFTTALARVLGDADLRARLTHGARMARRRLSRWEDACARMASVLERATGER